LSGDKISDHFTQETSSDKTHREVSPQKWRASNGRKLHAESSSREIPCRSRPRNGKGEQQRNAQCANGVLPANQACATNGTIAQYLIRVDDAQLISQGPTSQSKEGRRERSGICVYFLAGRPIVAT
jgi:hypothetical protein